MFVSQTTKTVWLLCRWSSVKYVGYAKLEDTRIPLESQRFDASEVGCFSSMESSVSETSHGWLVGNSASKWFYSISVIQWFSFDWSTANVNWEDLQSTHVPCQDLVLFLCHASHDEVVVAGSCRSWFICNINVKKLISLHMVPEAESYV